MDYRRIHRDDIDTVAEFAIRGLRPDRTSMHVSADKVRSVIEHFMTSQTDFHLGAFDGADMTGGIAVTVSPMLFFERAEAHIVMLFATVPGVGFRLLREAMEWVGDRPYIRRVLWSLEDDAEHERMARIAARFGFAKRHTLLARYRAEGERSWQ